MSVEEQLERTEKEVDDLRHALDQSSIVAFTDSKGTITYVNDKFCEISKYPREELIGRNHRIINSGYHSKDFFLELWKTISSGRTWRGEIRNRAKDGSHYWVFTTIIPFMTAKGRPFQYVAIRTDITDLKVAQEEAEQRRVALIHSEKMASLGELAAGIAHELGNPLAAMQGRMEMLEMAIRSGTWGQADVQKAVDHAKVLTERMARIIRGMKSLSRDGARDPFQKVSVGSVLNDVLAFASDGFDRHGIDLQAGDIDERVEIVCQETQISQVFVNLLNNAKDAVTSLGPQAPKWIRIGVRDLGGSVEVSVTDSGGGIPREIRDKIMLPFFTTKPTGRGSGLGLSISSTILAAHQGSMRIDADCPNTRFVVTLPKRLSGTPV